MQVQCASYKFQKLLFGIDQLVVLEHIKTVLSDFSI
jgi:hypothetical protein